MWDSWGLVPEFAFPNETARRVVEISYKPTGSSALPTPIAECRFTCQRVIQGYTSLHREFLFAGIDLLIEDFVAEAERWNSVH